MEKLLTRSSKQVVKSRLPWQMANAAGDTEDCAVESSRVAPGEPDG